MMKAGKLWSTLQSHWATYAKKYHKYSYVCNKLLMGVHKDHVDTSEQENDDDCVVVDNDDRHVMMRVKTAS